MSTPTFVYRFIEPTRLYSLCWLLVVVSHTACVAQLQVPEQTKISCDADAQCPTGYQCNLDLERCVPRTNNQAPIVRIAPVEHSIEEVTLELTVIDDESDPVDIGFVLRSNGSSTPIELAPTTFAASPEGVVHTVVWDALAHFGRSGFISGLVMELTPRDATGVGALVATEPFDFGNDPPVLISFDDGVDSSVTRRGVSPILFTVSDSANDPISISRFEFSLSGNFDDTISVPLDATHFPATPLTQLEGSSLSLLWDTGRVANVRDPSVRIRMQVADKFGAESAMLESEFAIDNAPTVSLGTLLPAGTRFVNTATVPFSLTDPNGDYQSVSVAFEYTLDDPTHRAATWYPATPHSTSDPLANITAFDVSHTFIWDILSDAQQASSSLNASMVDTTGDEVPNAPVVNYVASLVLRARPVDSGALAGDLVMTGDFSIGNDPPVVTASPITSPASGLIPVGYHLADTARDLSSVQLQFRFLEPDGITYDTWRALAVAQGPHQDVVPGLLSSGLGQEYLIAWDSRSEPLSGQDEVEQGVGNQRREDVQIRMRGFDSPDGIAYHYGQWSQTSIAEIANQSAPRVADIVSMRPQTAAGASPVDIVYRLFDAESDPVDVDFEFSFDDGATWQRCLEYRDPSSEGRYRLASAPERADGSGGVRHRFLWDPTGETFQLPETTVIRITASDGNSPPVQSPGVFLARTAAPPGQSPNESPYFSPGATPSGGSDPYNLAAADLDGNGFEDIVVINRTGTTPNLAVHRVIDLDAMGNPIFAPPDTYLPGKDLWAVAIADVNADGALDLLVTDRGEEQLIVLTGDIIDGEPVGSFTLDASYPTETGPPLALVVRDFDGDGALDVVTTINEIGASVETYLGDLDSPGTFAAPVYDSVSCTAAQDIVAADFDQDGLTDIAVICLGGQNVMIRFNEGDAGTGDPFGPRNIYPVGGGVESMCSADFNGDGFPDIATANRLDSTVSVLLNDGTGGMLDAIYYGTGSWPRGIACDDVNGDGVIDLIVTEERSSGYGSLFLGHGELGVGTGIFSLAESFYAAAAFPRRGITADLTGDGFPEIVVSSHNSDEVKYLRSRFAPELGPASFTPDRLSPGTGGYPAAQSQLVDLNGDGIEDLVLSVTYMVNRLVFAYGSGLNGANDGRFKVDRIEETEAGLNHFVVEDLNGDGTKDLIYAAGKKVVVLLGLGAEGIGNGAFGPPTVYSTDPATVSSVGLVDFDGDGVPDLAMTQPFPKAFVVWRNTGSDVSGMVTFDETPLASVTLDDRFPQQFITVDVDVDGDPDFIIMSRGLGGYSEPGHATVVLNNAGTLVEGVSQVLERDPRDMLMSDLNWNGMPDIVFAHCVNANPYDVWMGEGANGVPSGSFAYSAPAVSGCWHGIMLGDVDGDGVSDLAGLHNATAIKRVEFYLGGTSGGIGDGSFEYTMNDGGSSDTTAAIMGDLNGDGVLDYIGTNVKGEFVANFGQLETFYPLSKVLPSYDTSSGPKLLGSTGPQAVADHLDRPYFPAYISQHIARSPRQGELLQELRNSGLTLPQSLVPLTPPVVVHGDRRLVRSKVELEDGSITTRLRVVNNFGTPVDPLEPGYQRSGLDLSPETFEEQSGIIVELPIPPARLDSGAVISLDNAVAVRVYRRSTDWRRSDTVSFDPVDAHEYLPCRINAEGDCATDLLQKTHTWAEIPLDADADFSTGSGERFYVVPAGEPRRRVRVLVEQLGVFRAFLQLEE